MKLAVLLFALSAQAQLFAADEIARKLVEVKYVNPNSISGLLVPFGVNVRADNQLKAVVLSGPPDAVTQAEAAIRKLDVPPPVEKNIELIAYMVMASNEAQTTPEPADLGSAIKQMRAVLAYKSYRLLDTIWVRGKAGGGSFQSGGLAPASLRIDPNFTPMYSLSARGVWKQDGEDTIRFADLNLTLTLREKTSISIGSNVDVRPGQKVVIGKTNPTGTDSALILVVTARVVE